MANELEHVLDAWRGAERDVEKWRPGSPEREAAEADAWQLRTRYHSVLAGPGAMAVDPEDADPPYRD